MSIPLPLQVVIDDVGWWSGTDGHEKQEPYRTGIARRHCLADYAAIVELGKRLNMRPQAGLVMCEWDRRNSLRKVPSATWMGANWTCQPFPADEATGIVDLFNRNPSHVEPTLHAVGHEYWTGETMSRAEWYDRQGNMRNDVQRHLDAFLGIYSDAGFRQPPESYIPAAFLHRFGDDGKGLAGILKQAGIRHISTPYRTMFRSRPTEYPLFGIEEGLMTLDRGSDLAPWYAIGPAPAGNVSGPICGMHWPNILHPDPSRNAEVVDQWVNLLTPYDSMPDRVLSRNTRDCWTQLAHHSTVAAETQERRVVFDFTKLNHLNAPFLDGTFTIKIAAPGPLVVTSPDMTIEEDKRAPVAGITRLKVSRKDAKQSKGTLECITRSS